MKSVEQKLWAVIQQETENLIRKDAIHLLRNLATVILLEVGLMEAANLLDKVLDNKQKIVDAVNALERVGE